MEATYTRGCPNASAGRTTLAKFPVFHPIPSGSGAFRLVYRAQQAMPPFDRVEFSPHKSEAVGCLYQQECELARAGQVKEAGKLPI